MSKAVIPIAPDSLFDAALATVTLPSHATFMVNAWHVHSPQTGHPWYVEMDHEMGHLQMYSLIPQKNNNQFVSHYKIESRRPRFLGKFQYTDAWITSNHRIYNTDDMEVHFSQCLFHPERADNRLYFDRAPHKRIEIIVRDRLIEDREVLDLLAEIAPKGLEIRSLLQHLP